MRPSLLAALALTAIAGLGSSPASAEIVYVIVTGTVASGTQSDGSGLFGSGGANLAGNSYTARHKFNTNLSNTYSYSTENYAYGGSSWRTRLQLLEASLTINDQPISIAGSDSNEIFSGSIAGCFSGYDANPAPPPSAVPEPASQALFGISQTMPRRS